MKQISLLVFLLIPLVALCQNFPSYSRNQIKFSILRPLDFAQPGIEAGYERLHDVKFGKVTYMSSQLSGAWLGNLYGTTDPDLPRGFRGSFEEKLFFTSRGHGRLFIAMEAAYVRGGYKRTFRKEDSVTGIIEMDTVNVNRQTKALNVKGGAQVLFGQFVFEIAFGLGVKTRVINYGEKKFPESYYIFEKVSQGPWFYDPKRFAEGKSVTFNLPVNIKVGFSF